MDMQTVLIRAQLANAYAFERSRKWHDSIAVGRQVFGTMNDFLFERECLKGAQLELAHNTALERLARGLDE
jgi:hypothetical protein